MRGLLFFFVLLLFGWYAFSGYWYNCKIKNRCNQVEKTEPYAVPVEKKDTKVKSEVSKIGIGDAFMNNIAPLTVTGYQFKNGQPKSNIYFKTDTSALAIPVIDDEISPYLNEIADHLKTNQNSNLKITGYYTNQEAATYQGKNLGLDRANNVKKYLVKAGLSDTQIETKSLQNNNLKTVNKNVVGALNLLIKKATPTKTLAKPTVDIAKAIEKETKTVYFKYNSSEIIITKQLTDYVARLKLYLKQNPTKQVAVTGYTDSQGNRQQNINLGLKRANFVRQFLSENGITSKQIKADSKGSDKPVASNKTAEGRKQNRRVEITFN